MDKEMLIEEIQLDLGSDVNSLGISEDTIELKIKEAIRKISSYTPYREAAAFPVSNNRVKLPDDTIAVTLVYNIEQPKNNNATYHSDEYLFSMSSYHQYSDFRDPFILLMQKNQMNTLQNFVSIRDWLYESHTKTLYLNNFSGTSVSIQYFRRYREIEEIEDEDLVQLVKEYSLALCKIIEGTIRRKLQNAPGAIQMDGDALVSEGMSEKERLDELIPKKYSYLRMGIRI